MLKKILAFTCLAMSMGANAALIYNHDGVNYEIGSIATSFAADEGLLTSQFWWGDENLAASVALASGPDINEVAFLYDYEFYSGLGWLGGSVSYETDLDNCCYSDPHLQGYYTNGEFERIYAVATVSNVSLPPTAWLFGSAMLGLLGMAKRKKV